MREWVIGGIGLCLVLLVPLSAQAKKPKLTISPEAGYLVSDGKTTATLKVEISDPTLVVKRIRIRASRGKVLKVSDFENGVAYAEYRGPKLRKPARVSFVAIAFVGKRRIKQKIVLQAVPQAPKEEVSHSFPKRKDNIQVIALLPFETFDVDESLAQDTELAIIRELDQVAGIESVAPGDFLADVSRYEHANVECKGDLQCIAIAGRYARSHRTLETRLAFIGGVLNIAMRLVDNDSGKLLGSVAEVLSDDPQKRSLQLHHLLTQLRDPQSYVGTLKIECAQEEAEVYIDNRFLGLTPLGKDIEGLVAGPHILQVSKPGYASTYRFVDVLYKKSSTLQVDLSGNVVEATLVAEESKTGLGQFYLATELAGVEVRLDGEPIMMTPSAEPITNLAAGKRRLRLLREGQEPVELEIELKDGMRTDIRLQENEKGEMVAKALGQSEPQTPLPEAVPPEELPAASLTPPDEGEKKQAEDAGMDWRFLAGLGSMGAGAIAMGYGGYQSYRLGETQDNAALLAQQARADDLSRAEYQYIIEQRQVYIEQGESEGFQATLGLAVGGGLLAAGGGLILWSLLAEETPVTPDTSDTTQEVSMGFHFAPEPSGLHAGFWLRW